MPTVQQMAKRPVGRPRKEPLEGDSGNQPKEKRGFLGFGGSSSAKNEKKGKTLLDKEVEELREPLQEALRDDATYADQLLWWYSQDESKPQIWSNMDDEEIAILADLMLRRAKRNPEAAELVNKVIDGADYFSALVITIPRAIQTAQQMAKRPKKQKRERKTA